MYLNNSTTPTIPTAAGETSRLFLGYGRISLCVGAVNTAPVEYLRINHDSQQISCQNGASFTGNLNGGSTQLQMSNGLVTLSGNVLPSAAGWFLLQLLLQLLTGIMQLQLIAYILVVLRNLLLVPELLPIRFILLLCFPLWALT